MRIKNLSLLGVVLLLGVSSRRIPVRVRSVDHRLSTIWDQKPPLILSSHRWLLPFVCSSWWTALNIFPMPVWRLLSLSIWSLSSNEYYLLLSFHLVWWAQITMEDDEGGFLDIYYMCSGDNDCWHSNRFGHRYYCILCGYDCGSYYTEAQYSQSMDLRHRDRNDGSCTIVCH